MRTLILFKHDCHRRGLIGRCLSRFEDHKLLIVALRVWAPAPRDRLEAHYAEHKDKAIFPALISWMQGGPTTACVLEGGDESIVDTTRSIIGPYQEIIPGTIRGDFMTAPRTMYNLVHGSDGVWSAHREVSLWFPGLD
jgi:nucleoside-diphosphate kinase